MPRLGSCQGYLKGHLASGEPPSRASLGFSLCLPGLLSVVPWQSLLGLCSLGTGHRYRKQAGLGSLNMGCYPLVPILWGAITVTKQVQGMSQVKTCCSHDSLQRKQVGGAGFSPCGLACKTGLGGWFYGVQVQADCNLSHFCLLSSPMWETQGKVRMPPAVPPAATLLLGKVRA
jgi:hypothetical protein